ncbi:MAG: InlB B-repeat-containing protein [Clostridia bacterium]|nr:InlB B-repeat-containing protein [Clostridia bacterium]
MALVIAVVSFLSVPVQYVKADSSIEIGYTVSKDTLSVGDTVDILFYFKKFDTGSAVCSAFQLDVYVDPGIFSVVSSECLLDRTGAMMSTTKYKDSCLKTIYFNTASGLPSNSEKITSFTLKLEKDFTVSEDVQLDIKTAIALDIDNNYFDMIYQAPILKCVPSASDSSPGESVNESGAPTGTTPATAMPSGSASATSVPSALSSDSQTESGDASPSATASVGNSTNGTADATATAKLETIAPTEKTESAETAENPDSTASAADEETEPTDTVLYKVTYCDSNGRIITTEGVLDGKAATNSDIPVRPGYIFEGWMLDKGTLQKVECDITATAVYVRSNAEYTVNVSGGVLSDGTQTGGFVYDECAIVTLDESEIPEGKYFAGWTKSGSDKVISCSKTYSFLVRESTDVAATYSDSQPDVVPSVVMYDHSFYMEAGVFSCERNVPAGYAYSGSGIIVTKTEAVGDSEEMFVLNAENTSTYRADDNAVNASFSVVHTDISDRIYARAYLIYKNESGEKYTIYSDIEVYDPVLYLE